MAGTVSKLYNAMFRFFQSEGFQFRADEKSHQLRIGLKGKNGHWQCTAQVLEENEQFLFYSILPDEVPKNKLAVMTEFLTRVNYGLYIGCFELDFKTGEVRYKTAFDFEGHILSQALMKNAVYVNIHMMDRFLPGIKAILEKRKTSPLEELEKIERMEEP